MKAVDYFRAIDDSDLSPYEARYALRVWRRGKCWQKVNDIAKETGMSRRQAYNVRQSLLDKGWIKTVVDDGRVVYIAAIPDCCVSAPDAQEVHTVHDEVHTVHEKVHGMRTLPYKKTTEVDNIKYDGAHTNAAPDSDGGGEEAQATRRAITAVLELTEFWQDLTRRRRPSDEGVFRETWFKPFNDIWLACGRDVDAAKAKVQAVRNDMLAQGLTILDPAKLPGHVQTMIDRELLPMTERFNGNGRVKQQAPKSVSTPAPGSQPVTW